MFPYCRNGNKVIGVQKLVSWISSISHRPFAVLGDLNARTFPTKKAAGRFLEQFIAGGLVHSLCDNVPTHGDSHLDYILISPGLPAHGTVLS
ncbi:MAG: hypothetical protein RL675_351 [Bacteroidota bacterium]|jgi:hypothetical protein